MESASDKRQVKRDLDWQKLTPWAVVTLTEAAEALGIDARRIARAIREGKLPASRLGKRTWRLVWGDCLDWLRKENVEIPDESRSRELHRQADRISQSLTLKGGA
jgi:excisionase family DNA binding protein